MAFDGIVLQFPILSPEHTGINPFLHAWMWLNMKIAMNPEPLSQVPLMISGVPIALMNAPECSHANPNSRRFHSYNLVQMTAHRPTCTKLGVPLQLLWHRIENPCHLHGPTMPAWGWSLRHGHVVFQKAQALFHNFFSTAIDLRLHAVEEDIEGCLPL